MRLLLEIVAPPGVQAVDVGRLQISWQRLIQRHPMMRTIFLQNLTLDVFAVQATLLGGLAAQVRQTDINPTELLHRKGTQFEHRGKDWLPQLTLYETSNNRVFALLEINHALTDSTSLPLLIRDWERLYDEQQLSPVGLEYRDYVSYLRNFPTESTSHFWQSYLDEFSPCLFPQLNTGLSETGAMDCDGPAQAWQTVSLDIGDQVVSEYHQFCEQNGITLATVFKLAWGLVLRCFTGSHDVCFGYTTSGRDAPLEGIEDTLGPFINTLIHRMRISSDMSLLAALRQAQSDFVRSFPHQRMPLAEIRQALNLTEEVMCNTSITFPPEVSWGDDSPSISFRVVDRRDPTEYDIVLEVATQGRQHIHFDIKYWTSVLSEEQAKRLANTLSLALNTIVKHPQHQVGQIDLFGEEDEELIAQWNLDAPEEVGRCLHHLIEQQCRDRPDALAVCAHDGDWTYRQLDEQASRLAHHLLSLNPNIGPEVFVPLCFAKSRWVPVAVLAVLKAGAAFALLDPSLPLKRLQEICDDLQPPLVLASVGHHALAAQLAHPEVEILLIGDEQQETWPNYDLLPTHELPTVNPHNPVYVVFTSGSTGKPRGVVIEHRSFCASVLTLYQIYNVNAESRVLQFSSYAFDASLLDTLMPLAVGACLCIPSDHDRHNRLAAVVNDFQPTLLATTPSVARLLSPEQLPSLKTLALGGEPMLTTDIQSWAKQLDLINVYGPAECSVTVTVQAGITPASDPARIGHATRNAATWIVDPNDHEKLVPVGVVGELVIEGPAVGRGYLQNPEQTAAHFIDPPRWLSRFRNRLDNRLYKTGDLVQYAADGALRYMGRKDTQIKIRGQRLELGEIEYHLREHFPAASNVVVEAVVPREKDRPILVAFVHQEECQTTEMNDRDNGQGTNSFLGQPNEAFHRHVATVRPRLDQVLPSYMMPAIYIPVIQMPYTKSGKTDRRSLRLLVADMPRNLLDQYNASLEVKRAPSTEMERVLQGYFAPVLDVPLDQVGANDHFFRRGGDSIAAMKLVGIARQEGRELSVADVFNHPQLSALASVVRSIRNGQQNVPSPFTLLDDDDQVRQAIVAAAVRQCQVSQDLIEDIYPCTALQEGLLALTARQQDSYVAHLAFSLPSDIDLDRLQAAWNAVAEANPILRTRVVQLDSHGIFQVVIREKLQWTVSSQPNIKPSQHLQGNLLLGSPLANFVVQDHSADDRVGYKLFLTIHHALYDAWTLPLIFSQVEAAYQGETVSPRPFSPFVRYLRSIQGHEAYWQSVFAGLEAPVFPRLPSPSYQPTPRASTERIVTIDCSTATAFTQTTYVRLAWAITQSQYQGHNDVLFGLVVSGRNAPVSGIEAMTGPAFATIPWRVLLDPAVSVHNALEKLQDNGMAGIPFEQTGLQNIRLMGHETSMACSFQTLLVVQQSDSTEASSIFKHTQFAPDYSSFATYALNVICDLDQDSIKFQAIFDDKVVPEAHVQRILTQFTHILRRLYETPEIAIRDTLALNPVDHETLSQWNSDVPPAADSCVHEIIQRRCSEHPDAPAIDSWDGRFIYSQLDIISTQLARHLASKGVGPEVFVPILFEKSCWTPVAMLAVMKAGGAFVLLDPSHPQSRLENICYDIGCKLIVSSEENAALATTLAEQRVIVGNNHQSWADLTEEWCLVDVKPQNALYVIFTSGSTGKPKGVVIEHGSCCSAALAYTQRWGFSNQSRVLQFASYAFDASVGEIISTLMSGGCVCVLSDSQRRDTFVESSIALRITHALLTPTFVRSLPVVEGLFETLILVGEQITDTEVTNWMPYTRLMNGYGPSECSIISTVQPIIRNDSDLTNIGHPTGAVCWVVNADDHNTPVPIGGCGELLIEGPIVGRGYLNNPERTAATFIDSPPWLRKFRRSDATHRIYKTGDLVRFAVDGSICYMGRKDQQVKLRGQRLELGEVESNLRQYFQHVQDVVVDAMKVSGDQSSPELVAYVCLDGEQKRQEPSLSPDCLFLSASDLFKEEVVAVESKLREVLPTYMLPSVFVPLAFTPRTMSGKIDRQRLRHHLTSLSLTELAAYRIHVNDEKQSPSTEAEKTLQKIWAQVLDIPPATVGVNDNFFYLGGNSISAMRVAAMARDEGLDVAVSALFEHPILSDLAQVSCKNEQSAAPLAEPFSLIEKQTLDRVLEDLRSQGPLPEGAQVIDILPATWTQQQFLKAFSPAQNCFFLRGEIDRKQLRAACEALMSQHSILRTLFVESAGTVLQVVLESGAVPLIEVQINEDLRTYCQSKMQEDHVSPNLGTLPLKFTLVSTSDSEHALIVRILHTQYDGFSLPFFIKDFSAAYSGNSLLPLQSDFRAFVYAYTLTNHEAGFQHWRKYLEGSSMTHCTFTVDEDVHCTPETQVFAAVDISLSLPPPGVALTNLVKAAWSLILAKKSSSTDVVFADVVTGRRMHLPDIGKILGPCVNYNALRVKFDPDWTVLTFLEHVQAQFVQTIRYDYLSWAEVVRNSTSWANEAFGSVFNHQSQAPQQISLDGLENISVAGFGNIAPSMFPTILSSPWPDKLSLQVLASNRVMNEKAARSLAQALATTVEALVDSPDRQLQEIFDLLGDLP